LCSKHSSADEVAWILHIFAYDLGPKLSDVRLPELLLITEATKVFRYLVHALSLSQTPMLQTVVLVSKSNLCKG